MKTLKVYYANIHNMGDRLNELLIQEYFGYKVERRSFLEGSLSAIGSGLSMYQLHGTPGMRVVQRLVGCCCPFIRVWGTGFIDYEAVTAPFFKKRMRFCAVRGELSKSRAEKLLGRSLEIPTGDGGILVSELFPVLPEKCYEVGIVPHICDKGLLAVNELAASYEKSVVIDVSKDPYEVLKKIAECKIILSSSLHGLIAADSFGIPNRHVIFSDKLLGDGFKFDDYYSAYGIKHSFTDLRKERTLSLAEIENRYMITPEMTAEKKRLMKKAFPYPSSVPSMRPYTGRKPVKNQMGGK